MEVHNATFRVKTYECCSNGIIRIASLMQYLQEAAAVHAEELGFGFERLSEMNGYWVLSNFRMDIIRLPTWGDELTIRTWPSGYNRVAASREFIGKDRDDRELFRAGSEWMILDKLKNRPKNLFRLDLDLPKTGNKALSEELIRLQRREDYQEVDHVRVPYSSIDLNGHVNNTEYVRWGFDALRKAFRVGEDVRCIQVNYLSEIFEGDELDLLISSGAGGHFHILGMKSDTKTDVYVMEVTC
jgi:medium-chain acyl-[acyl-carrier-protein] hydrolase